jgi:LytS/YehU family sensor histidine kinase
VKNHRWWIAIAACSCAALLAELPQTILLGTHGAPQRIAAQLLRWLLWGIVFAPIVYRVAHRRGIVWVAVGALPVMLLYSFIVGSRFHLFQPIIVFTLTAGYGLLAQNEERRVAAERARMIAEERFTTTQIETLRSELQPHFLFNALNTVSALAAHDANRAAAIAEKLRDLFRSSVGSALPQVVAVEEEVAFTRKYLDIQEARFEERLRTSFAIEQGVARARVPALLLQPLVENAIRHGMTRREGITIDVDIDRVGEELRLRVSNDGLVDEGPVIEGIGHSNTRARLRALYGDAASFIAQRREEGGFLVDVRIPYDDAESS